jgi:hypothetical protein
MSLPLPTLGWYRLPDQVCAAATINALLDAIYAALTQTVDVFAVTLPSSATWTWAKDSPAGTTQAVYTTALPSGTPMTRGLKIIIAGKTGAPTPQMWVDSFTASNVLIGYALNAGAYNAWDAASPFTSGVFSGYIRVGGTTFNATATYVRAYVSAEAIFLQIVNAATTQCWCSAGAIVEPLTSDTVNDGETDNRVYGMMASGGTAATNYTFTGAATQGVWEHSATGGGGHCGLAIPGTLVSGAGGINAATRYINMFAATTTTQFVTPSGAIFSGPLWMGKSSQTGALGRLREIYLFGKKQSGLSYTLAGTAKLHVVSKDTSTDVDAFALKCP